VVSFDFLEQYLQSSKCTLNHQAIISA